MDSKADFGAMMNELDIPEKARKWLNRTRASLPFQIWHLLLFSQQMEMNYYNKFPNETWTELGFNPTTTNVMTTVVAGKLRRLLAQCRMVIPQFSSSAVTSTTSTPLNPVTSPVWHELAPPRLTPEAVAQMVETFQTNYPGELLTPDTTPSIRLLSVIHHYMKPGQAIKYIPWQIRMSQKQYQEMTEAKTHKAIRSEAQLLGALWDETPEIPLDSMRLSSEWAE